MSKPSRWVQVGSAGLLAATLAAFASLALGDGQPPKTKSESGLKTAGRTPEKALEPVLADAAAPLVPLAIDPPAPRGATSPALASEGATTVSKGHDILLTWLEPSESGGRLRFARFSEQTWSEPITISTQVSMLEPVDRSSLTVFDTQAVRRTLIARTGDIVARSGDAGRTWSRLPAPALPFASIAGGDEGGYVFWLDADGHGAAKLKGTRVLAGEAVLDPRVSDASGTSAIMTWDGPVVVYRDESPEGALDIAMVRRENAQWTPPHPVHTERWRPARKPKSGPQVAALRRQVAVAWYTEAPDGPRVLVAFSSDAGRTFGPPAEIDARRGGHAPLEPVAVALADNGDALVLWLAGAGPSAATLHLARVSPEGNRGKDLVLAKGLPTRPEDVPQITRAGGQVAVSWIEGVSGRVRTVVVPLAGIPAAGSRRVVPARAPGGAPSTPYSGRGRVGEPVPDLELMTLDGHKTSLAALRGQAVLLNLWATWCLPCIGEMPELATLQEHYGPQGLVMVGVSVDDADATDRVRAFVAERKVPFAVWLDPEMRLHRALRVRALPVTLIIDREGRIVLRRDRTIKADDEALRKALSSALSD